MACKAGGDDLSPLVASSGGAFTGGVSSIVGVSTVAYTPSVDGGTGGGVAAFVGGGSKFKGGALTIFEG